MEIYFSLNKFCHSPLYLRTQPPRHRVVKTCLPLRSLGPQKEVIAGQNQLHEFGVTQSAIFVDVEVIQDKVAIFLKVLRPLILLKEHPNVM